MLLELVAVILILIGVDWVMSSPFYWRRKGVPSELPVPLLGSTWTAIVEPSYRVWKAKYDKWKRYPYYGFHFFRSPALFISDPEVLKKISVSDADYFMSHGFKTNQDIDPFTRGMFHLDGEQWKAIRAKLSPYFSPTRVKGMTPLLEVHLDRFIEKMERESTQGPVEVQQDLSMRLTTDVIVSSSFGLEANSFSEGNPSYFYNLQKQLFNPVSNLKVMLGYFSNRLYDLLGFTFFPPKVMKQVNQFIRDAVEMRCKGIGVQPDILQGLVDLMKNEENHMGQKFNKDGTRVATYGLADITAQAFLMYVAGSETTGNALGFTLHELAFNQEIQDKVRSEIFSVRKDTSTGFKFEDIQNMSYTQMVIQETLRKYPVLPFLPRKCTKDYQLGDVKIEKGTMVMSSIYGLHMDPKYYSEPEKFIPERFASDANIVSGTYLPFGAGPRTCIGKKFALNEISFALARILSKFRLMPSNKSSYNIAMDPANLTMAAKNGIWLNIERL